MQKPFDNSRTFAPRPLRTPFQRQRFMLTHSKSEEATPKSIDKQLKTSFLLNDNSTMGGSEITFSDFENELEQESVWNELTSILNNSSSNMSCKCNRKIIIERAGNPFEKNFEDDDC